MPKFPGRGPKDWSPIRIEKILEGLEDLTVDTHYLPERDQIKLVSRVTMNSDGTLSGFHLTEEPERVAYEIKRGDLSQEKTLNEWPIGGILVNHAPEVTWRFSPQRWEPMRSLDREDREYLESLIMLKLYAAQENGQIVKIEYDRAARTVKEWRKTGSLGTLMDSPWADFYGIDIAGLAEENLPINPWRPFAVPVVFKGRYLQHTREAELQSAVLAAHHLKKPQNDIDLEDILQTWKDLGWDGLMHVRFAYALGGILLWNPEKILSYGTREESRRVLGRA